MKQTLESRSLQNLQAWFKETGCPGQVIETGLLAPRVDRAYFHWTPEVEAWMVEHCDPWGCMISDHQPLECITAIRGWRERRGRWAAQPIKHYHALYGFFGELDFDPDNPNWGLLHIALHAGWWISEKCGGPKVSAFTVAKKRGWEAAAA